MGSTWWVSIHIRVLSLKWRSYLCLRLGIIFILKWSYRFIRHKWGFLRNLSVLNRVCLLLLLLGFLISIYILLTIISDLIRFLFTDSWCLRTLSLFNDIICFILTRISYSFLKFSLLWWIRCLFYNYIRFFLLYFLLLLCTFVFSIIVKLLFLRLLINWIL